MNKHNVLTVLAMIVFFILTYAVITCAWVGAEYIFDKTVHTSSADSLIAAMLSYYISRDMHKLDRKYGRKTK